MKTVPLVRILGQGLFVPAGLCKDQALNSFANTLRFGCYPRQLRDYVNVGGRTENFRISMEFRWERTSIPLCKFLALCSGSNCT